MENNTHCCVQPIRIQYFMGLKLWKLISKMCISFLVKCEHFYKNAVISIEYSKITNRRLTCKNVLYTLSHLHQAFFKSTTSKHFYVAQHVASQVELLNFLDVKKMFSEHDFV